MITVELSNDEAAIVMLALNDAERKVRGDITAPGLRTTDRGMFLLVALDSAKDRIANAMAKEREHVGSEHSQES